MNKIQITIFWYATLVVCCILFFHDHFFDISLGEKETLASYIISTIILSFSIGFLLSDERRHLLKDMKVVLLIPVFLGTLLFLSEMVYNGLENHQKEKSRESEELSQRAALVQRYQMINNEIPDPLLSKKALIAISRIRNQGYSDGDVLAAISNRSSFLEISVNPITNVKDLISLIEEKVFAMTEADLSKLEILDVRWDGGDSAVWEISGRLRNNSGKPSNKIIIKAFIYSESGNLIDTRVFSLDSFLEKITVSNGDVRSFSERFNPSIQASAKRCRITLKAIAGRFVPTYNQD